MDDGGVAMKPIKTGIWATLLLLAAGQGAWADLAICGYQVQAAQMRQLIDESSEDIAKTWRDAGRNVTTCADSDGTEHIVVLNDERVETVISVPRVCVVKPFGDGSGRLNFGVFVSGQFYSGYRNTHLDAVINARDHLLASGTCRLPNPEELPTCEIKTTGTGFQYVSVYHRHATPTRRIGDADGDEALQNWLSEFRSGKICK